MLDISNEIPGLLMLPELKIIFASEAAFFDSRCKYIMCAHFVHDLKGFSVLN